MVSKKILKINHIGRHGWSLLPYSSPRGVFFMYRKGKQITRNYFCRVEFHWDFRKNTKFIGFKAKGLNAQKLNKFFDSFLYKLGAKSNIVFYNTDLKNTVILELPKFWTDHGIKRSLLTLLIRAYTYNRNFNKAINIYPLARKVEHAINLFLDGNTKPVFDRLKIKDWEGFGGFVAEFQNLTRGQILAKLTKENG